MFATGDCRVENGFFLVKGPQEGIQRMTNDDKHMELITKSLRTLEHLHVDMLNTQERIPKLMELSAKVNRQPVLAR